MDVTQAQIDALDRVREILKEHFEASVVGYHTEVSDKSYAHGVEYNGPIMSCLGISCYVHAKIKDVAIGDNEMK